MNRDRIPSCSAGSLALTLVVWGSLALHVRATAQETGFVTPEPQVLEIMRRELRPNDRFYVTTPSSRFEVRIGSIDATGLQMLPVRKDVPALPTVNWSEIARIERRHSGFRMGQATGLVVGTLVGGVLGEALGNSSTTTQGNASSYMVTGLIVGAVGGAWLGGSIGDKRTRASIVYVGRSLTPGAPPTLATVTATPAEMERIHSRMRSSHTLRVRGGFGEFIGSAAVVDSVGLHGLSPNAPGGTAMSPEIDSLAWSEIMHLHRRGNASRIGAGVGALTCSALGALVFGAVAAGGVGLSSGGSSEEVAAAVAGGAVAGALVGAGAGALIGAAFPRWHRVSPLPARPPKPAPAAATGSQGR